MAPLPHATDEQVRMAVGTVTCVLAAAKAGNQHNENIIVLMDQATAMFQRNTAIEDLLHRCAEFIEPYVDVVDGAYGEPSPNAAMSLLSAIREVVPAA